MKKLIALVLVICCLPLMALATTTPSTGTTDGYDPNSVTEFVMNTSQETPVFNIGEANKALYSTPILLTSFGQSADSSMLEALIKRAGITDYAFLPLATAADIANYKTVIIAVGASSKGLGAAGISEATETERADAIIAAIKENDVQVIMCHLGGAIRRGALSDKFTNMVLDVASFGLVVEDANFDYMFSNYAAEKEMPLTFIYAIVNGVAVFKDLFN